MLSEQERELLVGWLLESLQDAEQPDLAEQAMKLLFHFQAPELMVADSHPDREVPFPIVVLLDALGHVLAFPVEVSYTLPEALESLGSRFRYRRNDYFHFPLGHGLRAEPIHAAWNRGKTELFPEIEEGARAYLRAVRELLQGVRHHAADAIFAWTAKFALPAREEYPDRLLSRLAFFARYESLLDCLSRRHSRCEPHAAQLLTGSVMELRALGDTEFEIVGGAAMPVDPNGFPEWLLVSHNEDGRQAQLEYRDYACRRQLWQGQPQADLAVVGVGGHPPRQAWGTGRPDGRVLQTVCRRPPRGRPAVPAAPPVHRLHHRRRGRLPAGLRGRHGLPGDERIVSAAAPRSGRRCAPLPLPGDVVARAESLIDRLHLTASQVDAFRSICRRRAVPVWGPPGTGKTHFLAAVVLGLATAHADAGQPFRVLVTAFTHAAIENLLRKIVGLQQSLGLAGDLQVAKAKSWAGNGEAAIEVVEPADLAGWLHQRPRAVVGATVYATLKSYDELSEFDLVVIDEASQVRVPEAVGPDQPGGTNRPAGAGRRPLAAAADRQRSLSGTGRGRAGAAPLDLRSGRRPARPARGEFRRGPRFRRQTGGARRDPG